MNRPDDRPSPDGIQTPATMFLFSALASLFSIFPATLTLFITFVTAILFPAIAAIILGILELTTNIVTSSESVLVLVFSPPILLFPIKLVSAVGNPVFEAASLILAPALFPFQALLVFAAAVLSFVFEFKVRLNPCSSLCKVPFIGRMTDFRIRRCIPS